MLRRLNTLRTGGARPSTTLQPRHHSQAPPSSTTGSRPGSSSEAGSWRASGYCSEGGSLKTTVDSSAATSCDESSWRAKAGGSSTGTSDSDEGSWRAKTCSSTSAPGGEVGGSLTPATGPSDLSKEGGSWAGNGLNRRSRTLPPPEDMAELIVTSELQG